MRISRAGRLARKVLRHLGLERSFGLPKGCMTLTEHRSRFLPTYFERKAVIYPSSTVTHSLPEEQFSKLSYKFLDYRVRTVPEAFLATFDNGKVLTDKGVIVSSEGYIISDLSRQFGGRYSVEKEWMPLRDKTVDESVAVVTTDGHNTYYHWLFDILPRIHLLKEYDLHNKIERIVLPPLLKKFQTETLEMILPKSANIHQIQANEAISARHLVVPSLPSELGTINSWACEFLKAEILPHMKEVPDIGRKIYVKRGRNVQRTLKNEEEVIEFVTSQGFSIVNCEKYTVREQAFIFNNADVVLAPHGSALSNIVFCRQGTRIVELFSADFVVPCYWLLADLNSLKYTYFISTGEDEANFAPYYKAKGSDYSIAVSAIEEIIKASNF